MSHHQEFDDHNRHVRGGARKTMDFEEQMVLTVGDRLPWISLLHSPEKYVEEEEEAAHMDGVSHQQESATAFFIH